MTIRRASDSIGRRTSVPLVYLGKRDAYPTRDDTVSNMTKDASDQRFVDDPIDDGAPAPKKSWRRWYPGPLCWLIVAACALATGLMRSDTIWAGLEQAEVNLLTFVFGVTATTTLLVWYVFFSAHPRAARFSFAAVLAMSLVLVGSFVRVRDFSGDLVPDFAFRWQPEADQLLEQPLADSAAVYLKTTTADDFPQFLGPERNSTLTSPTLSTDWQANKPRELWRTPIGAGWSSFAVVNGFAVTMEQRGDQELVTCYEVATGHTRWSQGIDTRHQTALGGVGPRGTPTIHEGRVYAMGATGVLRCLDGADGREVWSEDLLARLGVTPKQDLRAIAWGRSASPLIVDHLVVVPLGGPADGPWDSLAAFDKETGSLVWKGGNHQASYSSPALATLRGERQILIVNQDYVSGHRVETGEQLWEFPWPGNSTTNANVSQVVRLSDSRVLVSKGYHGGAKVVEISLTDTAWLTTDVWAKERVLSTKFSNVVVREDYALGISDGILQCADIQTGQRLWRAGRYNQGQILGVRGPREMEDLLLVQAESGDVVLVWARREGHDELGRIAALDGKTWNNPALYGRLLLVRNGEQAACYELPTLR